MKNFENSEKSTFKISKELLGILFEFLEGDFIIDLNILLAYFFYYSYFYCLCTYL